MAVVHTWQLWPWMPSAEARKDDDNSLVIVEGTVLGEGAFSRVVKVRIGVGSPQNQEQRCPRHDVYTAGLRGDHWPPVCNEAHDQGSSIAVP